MKLTEKLRQAVKKYRLLAPNDSVVVALSGGPDSVCLLYFLNTLKKEFKLNLFCAHLDHKIRNDSYKDLLFTRKLAQKLRIPFFGAELNINDIKKNCSLEETARKARYDFLFKTADKTKSAKIALGHTKDDQAETVLMRLLRGSGLYGLSAISPKRKIAKYTLIRPLLDITKKEILNYLKSRKLKYCLDYTNKQDIYFRNRIRNRLIPELKKYNRNIADVLSNTAESVGLDYEYLKNEAKKYFKKTARLKGARKITLNTEKLLKLHPALKRMIFRLSIETLKGNLRRIDWRHIKELEDLLENRKIGSIVNLPQGVSFLKTEKSIEAHKSIA